MVGGARRFTELRAVAQVRDFRLLWAAGFVSDIGEWAARLALLVVVYARTGSPAWSAAVVTASLLPWVLGGPLLATMADRMPRRAVMIGADLLRAAVFAALILPLPTWALLVGVAVAGAASPVFNSARSALLPDLLGPERYPHGASLLATTGQVAVIAGYLGGGVGVAVFGASGALAANSVSFLVSAVLVASISAGRQPAPAVRETPGVLRHVGSAVRALAADPLVRAATVLATASQVGPTAVEALAVVYAGDALGRGSVTAGVLCAVVAAGMAVGAIVVPLRGDHGRLLRISAALIGGGSVVTAVAFILAGAVSAAVALPVAALGFAAAGFISLAMVPTGVIAFSRLPDGSRAAAAGVLQATVVATQATVAGLAGLAAAAVGVVPVFVVACLLGAVPAVWALTAAHRPAPARVAARRRFHVQR